VPLPQKLTNAEVYFTATTYRLMAVSNMTLPKPWSNVDTFPDAKPVGLNLPSFKTAALGQSRPAPTAQHGLYDQSSEETARIPLGQTCIREFGPASLASFPCGSSVLIDGAGESAALMAALMAGAPKTGVVAVDCCQRIR
jgi:hypothetical protein